MAIEVGIAGASGYVGAELMRLCASHPELDVVVAGSRSKAGSAVAGSYASLAAAYGGLEYARAEASELKGVDVCFLALPNGESQRIAPELSGSVGLLVDLAADFRLRDGDVYEHWYGAAHESPELLGSFVYGLPELFGDELAGARQIAAPGCYPTAASLAIAPFVRSGSVSIDGVVVDAASGLSGAGASLTESTHFAVADENFTAYGLGGHRHTPEIEQATGASVVFTPHLAPMTRGILATCYMRPAPGASLESTSAIELLGDFYGDAPFVVVSETSPSTKATLGSNTAHVTARVDRRTGWIVSICAIDNLVKGAAGQAIQCANVALGLAETTGLPLAGVYP